MEPSFLRKAFYTNEVEFHNLSFLTSPKNYGTVQIEDEGVIFDGNHGAFSIAIPDIKEVEVVNEKNYQLYKIFYIGYSLFLLFAFIQYIIRGPRGSLTDLVIFAISIPIIFYIIYLPLGKRKWLCVVHKQNEATTRSYFSFDWRTEWLRLPWNRQIDIWTWLINRGDCQIMQKVLKESMKSHQKENRAT